MNKEQLKTPILFIVFNRPDTTKKVFDEIKKQRPLQLFIAADGPRANKPDDEAKCREVREIVSDIDWPCEVKTLFRNENLGFAEGERTAFEWFFDNVPEGILLEDDGLPHPDFFRFASEMLERYRNDERVMMITGDNFLPDFKVEDSYFFSEFFSIWGWASWRRAWKKYDVDIRGWDDKKNKLALKKFYRQKYMVNHVKKMFDGIRNHTYITWDAQWLYACIMNRGLCIVPKVNLVSNIGIEGTHSQGHNQNMATHGIYSKKGLDHPDSIAATTKYDDLFYEKSFKPGPFNLKRYVISILVKYRIVKKIYRFFFKKPESSGR